MQTPEELEIRREKLEKMIAAGQNPYPASVERTHTIAEVLENFDALLAAESVVSIVGRLKTVREHGALTFANMQDGSGEMQIALRKDVVGEDACVAFHATSDMGDFLSVTGKVFRTKIGQQTVDASSVSVIAKALLPLPDKWHGLQDQELRFRKRYLDLIMDQDIRNRFVTRSKIISSIRSLLDARGFLEVETPTLQPVYGGGYARPFTTHHNTLDTNFYLRISDEMYLKRLIVGGFEKVYEITKVFRNEGMDRDHNPEFTMFEAQIAYQDYRYGMDLFEEIFEHAAQTALGTTDVKHGDTTITLARPWKRYALVDAVKEIGGVDVLQWNDLSVAKKELVGYLRPEKRSELDRMTTIGEVIAFAFEELVEEKLIQPTIIYDYPIEVSPLAKKCADARFTQRFEAFALGSEIGNNYSELNDPLDLEKRFVEEKKKEAGGFDEAHQTDNEYLDAIRHGMPPACGLGIGIDRMVILLTGVENIKEVILFPTLRPTGE